jgi:hypothetical protein
MKPLSLLLFLATAILLPAVSKAANPFAGRWDITITPTVASTKPYPDWMELAEKDGKTAMRIQPRSGSAYEVKEFQVAGSHLSIHASPANAKGPATTWELDLQHDKLTGTQKRGDAVIAGISGRTRAIARSQAAQCLDHARTAIQRQRPGRLGALRPRHESLGREEWRTP